MVSEEVVFNLSARRKVLRSFSLSDTETSVEHNLQCACAHHDSLMHQQVVAEDVPEMAQVLDAEHESVEQIIEEEWAHRPQVTALTEMQLQVMERVEQQERELRRLSALLVEYQEVLRSSPERPQQEPPQPPRELDQLRCEVDDILPGMVNTMRGAASTAGQVPDLGRPPMIRRDTFEDILADAEDEVPHTPQRQVWFANVETSTPIPRPVEPQEERTKPLGASQVPSHRLGLIDNPEPHKDLYEESFSHSLQVAATKFRKLREPKVAKFKGGYSSDASLVFQSWLKDTRVYVLECHLSQWEAIQLVKEYTSEQAQSEVEYYLGLTPKGEQSFQGLIDHLSLTFQSCKMVSSLIADFYNWSQKTRETEDMFANELQVLVQKIVAHKPEFISEANQALKHQFVQNLKDPYFGVIVRGQFLSSPDSASFTQFQSRLALMFNSRGKCAKVVSATSAAVDSGDTRDHLSHNFRKRQSKINAQAAEITAVKAELNKALEENKKLKDLFSPEKMIEAMTKAVMP